jgi:hypothetical protein
MRVTGICASFGSAVVALACTTGSNTPPPPNNSLMCQTFFTLTGTFGPPSAPNPNVDGCWPIGPWTMMLAKDTSMPDTCAGSGDEPTPLSMYVFDGIEGTDSNGDPTEGFMYVPDGSSDPNVNSNAKVTEGGPGCLGAFNLYDVTGTHVWQLNPDMSDIGSGSQVLTGSAEFDLYGSDQWLGSGT